MSGWQLAKEARINEEWAAMVKPCQGCMYLSGGRYCDYIGIAGHRRPCPPGASCTVKVLGDRRRKFDYEKIKGLYKHHRTDKEIAAIVGCSIPTVVRWRKKQGLKPNTKRSGSHGADHH